MDSKITLSVKDPNIRRQYTMERNKDILLMCFVSLIVRLLTMAAGLISIKVQGKDFDSFYWIMRASSFGWQLLLLLIGYKWPIQFTVWIAPLFLISFPISNLIPLVDVDPRMDIISVSFSGFIFFMFNAVILNYAWIYTSLSLILVVAVTLTFYCKVIRFCDMTTYTIVISLLILIIYTLYFFEKKLKVSFIQLHQIQKMNEEMKQLFDSLPEGIVLFN